MTSTLRSLTKQLTFLLGGLLAVAWGAAGCSGTSDPRDLRGSGGRASGGGGVALGGAIVYPGAGGEGPGIAACGDAPDTTGEFSKAALLAAAASCATYHTCEFSAAMQVLGSAVTAYREDPSQDHLEKAQQAWRSAMLAWAGLVPFEFGPLVGVGVDQYHGRGIAAYIHPWPAPNLCELSKQLVSRSYEGEGMLRVPPGARGLFALEALLFTNMSETGCSSASTTATTWAKTSEPDRLQARLDYAKAVVDDVYRRSEELVGVWSKTGENFGETLVKHEGYVKEQEALSVVGWSLLYVYLEVRDGKVAPFAGATTSGPNPETPFAHLDREAVLANLKSFRALFQGCADGAGLGFDDWLSAADATDLRDDILKALDAIEATAKALPPFHLASQAQMTAFYDDLKVLTDLLKSRLLGSGSPLNIKLPASAASDTD